MLALIVITLVLQFRTVDKAAVVMLTVPLVLLASVTRLFVTTEFDNLLKSEANVWSAAATAAGPIFTGGRLTGRYRQTKAAWEEARLSYQQTALTAFREVSDALISRRRFEEGRVEQAQAVGAGRQAVELATMRYKEGKASYYEVLEAQQQLFPAENTLSRIEAARRLAVSQAGLSVFDERWLATCPTKRQFRGDVLCSLLPGESDILNSVQP